MKLQFHYKTDIGRLYSEVNWELTEYSAFNYAYNLSGILPYKGVSLYNKDDDFRELIEEILFVIMPYNHDEVFVYSYLKDLENKYTYGLTTILNIFNILYDKLKDVHDLPVSTFRGWSKGYNIIISELN